MLERGEVDVALSDFSLTYERAKVQYFVSVSEWANLIKEKMHHANFTTTLITENVQVVDFGGNIVEQKVFAMIAKPGSNFQYYAYFNPLKPVSGTGTMIQIHWLIMNVLI